MVSEAIAKGDVAALNYFIADKYIEAFGQLGDSRTKDHHAAGGGDEYFGIARRHRRNCEGDLRRERAIGAGRRAPRFGAGIRQSAADAAGGVRAVRAWP